MPCGEDLNINAKGASSYKIRLWFFVWELYALQWTTTHENSCFWL